MAQGKKHLFFIQIGLIWFVKCLIKKPDHYNNEKGSLYKFAQDHNLNAW